MNVNNIGSSSPVQKIIANPIQRQIPAERQTATRAADRLELSGAGHLLQTLKSNDVRADKVTSIRAQIDAGKYEDDAKLNAAIDKLIDDLNS